MQNLAPPNYHKLGSPRIPIQNQSFSRHQNVIVSNPSPQIVKSPIQHIVHSSPVLYQSNN